MDLSKLGSSSWNASGSNSAEAILFTENFLDEANQTSLLHSIATMTNDKNNRNFLIKTSNTNTVSLPSVNLKSTNNVTGMRTKISGSSKKHGFDFSAVHENPPSRNDINLLDFEFEEKIRDIIHPETSDANIFDKKALNKPFREYALAIRNQYLEKYKITSDQLLREPWLEILIKCECLCVTSDSTTDKIVNMLSVISLELGNLLRKVRLTYKQAFRESTKSWEILRSSNKKMEEELQDRNRLITQLKDEISRKEESINVLHEIDLREQHKSFDLEKQALNDQLLQRDFRIEQLSDTLRSLNGILKSMQNSSSSNGPNSGGINANYEDLREKCKRLESENSELQRKVMKTDKLQYDLNNALGQIETKASAVKVYEDEITYLKTMIAKKDDGIAVLMEKDLLKSAEIEKLNVQIEKRMYFNCFVFATKLNLKIY